MAKKRPKKTAVEKLTARYERRYNNLRSKRAEMAAAHKEELDNIDAEIAEAKEILDRFGAT